jgi:hypothetical protein
LLAPGEMRTLLLLMPLMVAACAAHGSVPVDSMAAVATISHAMRKSPAPFDRYRTFIFGLDEPPPSGYHAATRTSEERRSLETFVADLLVEKGYALSSGAGDFSITLGSGTREFEVHDMIDDDSLPQGLNTTFPPCQRSCRLSRSPDR